MQKPSAPPPFPRFLRQLKRRARLLLNPIAGEGRARRTFRLLREHLKKFLADYQFDIYFSRHPGDLSLCAREAVAKNYDLIVVAGGDGAINETLQGMVGSQVPLAILPRGTANIFCEELGIPKNLPQALEVIQTGQVRRIDIGVANSHYFSWLSGVGVDALVAQEVHLDIKDKLGIFAYILFALKHLGSIPSTTIRAKTEDGELREEAAALLVGNACSFSAPVRIQGAQVLNDGALDCCLVRRLSPLFILRGLLFFALGRRAYYRDLKYLDHIYFSAKAIQVESSPPAFIHLDGEVLGKTPVHYHILPQALSLITPA